MSDILNKTDSDVSAGSENASDIPENVSGTENISAATDNAASENTSTQIHMDLNGRKIILVGTAHVSAASITEVENAIREELPSAVAIELDEKRLQSMEDPEGWRKMDIVKVLKNGQGFLMLANLVLAGYQKRMGQGAGIKPGDEMAAAIKVARELNIPQIMVDRPIAVTLQRAWGMNSGWGKMKLLSALIASAFSGEETSQEEIEQLKNKSEMDSMMEELSSYLPKVKEVLIDERDRYLASHIWQCAQEKGEGSKVLAVLGAGHLPGVQAHLEKLAAEAENTDCTDISELPKKSAGSKIAAWIIPVLIVAFIVLGFVYGGVEMGKKMVGSWLIWNGVLAGIGALVAGGHPLVILVSVLGAPFTSMCPFIGIGIVSGLLQAVLCKPKVSDMEMLQEDAATLKGFYKNRILRVLLVFLLSSVGSSIGTFVAGASFLKAISTFFDKIIEAVKSLFAAR